MTLEAQFQNDKQRIIAQAIAVRAHEGDEAAAIWLTDLLFANHKYGNSGIEYKYHLKEVSLTREYVFVQDASGKMVSLGEADSFHRIAGRLHDLLEDIEGWTKEDLLTIGFAPDVVEAVDALTKKEGEKYFDAMERLSLNTSAIPIKLTDLHANSNVQSLGFKPNEKDNERAAKYWVASRYLGAVHTGQVAPGTSVIEWAGQNASSLVRNRAELDHLVAIVCDNSSQNIGADSDRRKTMLLQASLTFA